MTVSEYGCPEWCDSVGAHEWDADGATGVPVRTHSKSMGELVEVMTMERAGEPAGSARIVVFTEDLNTPLTPSSGRQLAAALSTAADFLDGLEVASSLR